MYSIKAHDGQLYGPANLDLIQKWIGEGRIFPNTIIVDHVTDSEGPASFNPLIAPLFQSAGGAYQAIPQYAPGPGAYQSSTYQQPGTFQNQNWINPPQPSPYPGSIGGYPLAGAGMSHRTKLVAALLAFFLGIFGIHQFYLGKNGLGIAMLCTSVVVSAFTCGAGLFITGIWATIDLIMILTGATKDAEGRALA